MIPNAFIHGLAVQAYNSQRRLIDTILIKPVSNRIKRQTDKIIVRRSQEKRDSLLLFLPYLSENL